MMTRAEHMAWAKGRALEYLDAGDLQNAFSSFVSDITKHEETRPLTDPPHLLMVGMGYVMEHDAVGLRRWINGFA